MQSLIPGGGTGQNKTWELVPVTRQDRQMKGSINQGPFNGQVKYPSRSVNV